MTAGQSQHKPERQGEAHLRERVDHGCDRWLISGADVVKVQHALYRPGLHAPHDGLGVFAEEGCCLGYKERKTVRDKYRLNEMILLLPL